MSSQVLDFADTVFIIARGKWKQLSFLHYYHHVSIFLTYWYVAWRCAIDGGTEDVTYQYTDTPPLVPLPLCRLVTVAAYDGDVYYTIIANSAVHAAMYFYYLCTCFNVRPS